MLVDPDGANARAVGTASGTDYAWLPTGDVAFVSGVPGQSSIQVLDTLGHWRLFFANGIPGVTVMSSPTPSVDGQTLYFLANDTVCAPYYSCMHCSAALVLMNADGSRSRGLPALSLYSCCGAWSSDGRYLLMRYSPTYTTPVSDPYIVDLATQARAKLGLDSTLVFVGFRETPE